MIGATVQERDLLWVDLVKSYWQKKYLHQHKYETLHDYINFETGAK